MNKKLIVSAAVCAALFIALGVYVLNKKGNSFIDFSEVTNTNTRIDGDKPTVLLAYTKETSSYIAILNMEDVTISTTFELPFENNENIFIEQDSSGTLYVSNGVGELFKYNGSHFLKVPNQLYTTGSEVRIDVVKDKLLMNIDAGSMHLAAELTYTEGYLMKNAYVYSNVSDVDTLNLYGNSDPGESIHDSFIVLRVHLNEDVYYAFYDTETRSLRRMFASPFESNEGAFLAVLEDDRPILFVGGEAYDVNANEMISHDAVSIDEALVSVESKPYAEDIDLMASYVKGTDGQDHPYVIQSKYAIDYAYSVYK